VRHSFVDEEEGDVCATLTELADGVEGLFAGRRFDDPVLSAEVVAEVALDRVENLRVVVDGEDDGFIVTL